MSDEQLKSMLSELDANDDRRISASEFDAFCDSRRENIRQIFRDIDADGDGAVDSKELRRGVERAGLKISDEQLRAAFKRMDSDRDGRLSFDEFESTLMLLPHGANPEAVFDAFAHRAFVDDPDGFMTMPRDIDTGRRTSLSAHIREGMEEDDRAEGREGKDSLGDGGGNGETIGTAKKLARGGVSNLDGADRQDQDHHASGEVTYCSYDADGHGDDRSASRRERTRIGRRRRVLIIVFIYKYKCKAEARDAGTGVSRGVRRRWLARVLAW